MSYVLVEFLLDKTQPVVSSDDVRDFSGVVEDDKVYQVYWAGDARTKGSFYDAKVLYMAGPFLGRAAGKDSTDTVCSSRLLQNHWFLYNEKMQVESVAQAVSNLAIQFGDSDDDGNAMSRPFGVAILFAGIDPKGPQLYHMDPSGTYVQYDAKAIGSGSEGAQQALQEKYHKSMTLKEATQDALTILKQVMEEKLNSTNVEVANVTKEKGYHMLSKEEVEEVIKTI
ncbi:proteasome subunit alpha type-5 [Ixodes scapularis]